MVQFYQVCKIEGRLILQNKDMNKTLFSIDFFLPIENKTSYDLA